MAASRVEGVSRCKRLLRNISSYRVYVSTRQLTVFKNVSIILVQIVRTTLVAFLCDHLSAQHLTGRAAGLRRRRMYQQSAGLKWPTAMSKKIRQNKSSQRI